MFNSFWLILLNWNSAGASYLLGQIVQSVRGYYPLCYFCSVLRRGNFMLNPLFLSFNTWLKLSFKSEYSDGKCRFVCLGYSASYMHKIWTCCWCQLRMSCPGFDDNLLPNFLSHWKGKVLDGNFLLISLIFVLKIFKFGWLLLLDFLFVMYSKMSFHDF